MSTMFPNVSDITILPTTAWDTCEHWKTTEIPNNLKGKATEALGKWLTENVDGWPTSTLLPSSLTKFAT